VRSRLSSCLAQNLILKVNIHYVATDKTLPSPTRGEHYIFSIKTIPKIRLRRLRRLRRLAKASKNAYNWDISGDLSEAKAE